MTRCLVWSDKHTIASSRYPQNTFQASTIDWSSTVIEPAERHSPSYQLDNMQNEVSIIGAGIAGLTLALNLHTQGSSCAIYESRPSPQNIGGAVMLSPNSLKLFDDMGIYNDLKQLGYSFDTLYFRDVAGSLKETYPFGSVEKYGYSGLRVYRYQLIDLLLEKLTTTNIPIHYNHKFSHVVSESKDTVTW